MPQGPRELAEAATAFNTMADRVATMRAAERELIADLSHRLRTPLTALRLEAERVRGAERFGQAIEAMEHEVDHLIQTARQPAEARQAEPDVCDAERGGPGADDVLVRGRRRPEPPVPRLRGRPPGARCRSPRSDLAAALDALLGNVFRYTPQGTPFEVAVTRRDGYVAVRVDDAGPGISDPRSAVRRGTSERGSTGLGLDIVRRAALAGRGGVDIDRGALGGTSVVMLLADADADRRPRGARCGASSGACPANPTNAAGAAEPRPPAPSNRPRLGQSAMLTMKFVDLNRDQLDANFMISAVGRRRFRRRLGCGRPRGRSGHRTGARCRPPRRPPSAG